MCINHWDFVRCNLKYTCSSTYESYMFQIYAFKIVDYRILLSFIHIILIIPLFQSVSHKTSHC
jgi:hypothetical protein